MGKCRASKDKLLRKDSFKHQIKTWTKIISDTEVLCVVCDSEINVTKGFEKINASTSGLSSPEMAAPSCEECHDLGKSIVGTLKMISEKHAYISAELILAMECVISH
ncbi:hypothetical protein PR048_020531 [Dryococelus australis]|uniref:Uncharacterized protein n=1 Tax=Dryococelus australis TaxID=614101 RepID=A0ABQ9H6L2_9NEOP|nr:hypothetical protein PR048_020531 [Dryococelus australis]